MEIALEHGIVRLIGTSEAGQMNKKGNIFGDMEDTILNHTIHFTKAELMPDGVVGSILVPNGEVFHKERISLGYLLRKHELILIDDDTHLDISKKMLENINQIGHSTPEMFLYHMLQYLLNDELEDMQQIEEGFYEMEEKILNDTIENNPTKAILHYRKLIMERVYYYQQMNDMANNFVDNENHILSEQEILCFSNLADRSERLYDHAQMLREYLNQIREVYQQQLDIRQNKSMSVLTVITAIFLPLTLVAGWYGMNFANMPELGFRYSYLIVICICIVIIIGEIILFKKKKWF